MPGPGRSGRRRPGAQLRGRRSVRPAIRSWAGRPWRARRTGRRRSPRPSGVGQVATYSFEVRNTGNVTITDATVEEVEFSGAGDLSQVTCPTSAESLLPGDSVVCTATYTVVAEDLASGELSNTATATGGLPGGGTVTSDPSTASVDTNPPAPVPAPGDDQGTDTPAAAAKGDLPDTGSHAGAIVALGAALMAAAGLTMLVATRRREEV
ncbi:LPXTG cell wall anchor domain-containing protein [Aeromicrobium camelliae]|uniref:LPXTG cell wall anchor domain-containing protein n=1 Tax=Aeromicrobium camelliae TaxID=1538144 RepID=A0A3N6ZGY0_9ACTN|nr:LPXTG cell wall anchor domain-containing protein [Aeromicrobium camelliae]